MQWIRICQPFSVRAPTITTREKQRDCLETPVENNHRTAIATSTKRTCSRSFDFDLVVKSDVAHVISHNHVVQLERGDLASGQIRRPTDFCNLSSLINECWPQPAEFSQSFNRPQVGGRGKAARYFGDRSVNEVGSCCFQFHGLSEFRNEFLRVSATVKKTWLQDRITSPRLILVGQDVIIRKDEQLGRIVP
eukprot:TRINITY_DN1942_c0_g1_i3.p1 TRINITY_DN1942_c0_g1~~TRINITY_DN1942_c0_g1_i3.p1  ORF type:complete len:192 (-),score=18.39 TRINITY_DN1942_c0_g1_i3:107-682(-)